MSKIVNRVCAGLFLDSVILMQISRSITSLDGVEDAALMIGTPSNLDLLDNAKLLARASRKATGGDLILAVRARDEVTAASALAKAESLLERPAVGHTGTTTLRPRTLRSAQVNLPAANLALISVPGDFAAAEARKALRAGLNVMLFSDNVSLSEEVSLKREAVAAGLLVMGPDCGTAIIGGVPLAFANQIPQGAIGIIGASGTGIQEVSSLIAQAGYGVSHALGVGGRDLSDPVGGISTHAALAMLEADSATRHIVLISKPPSPSVAKRVIDTLAHSEKPCTVCFLGADAPSLPGNVSFARTLKAASELATGRSSKNKKPEFKPIIPHVTTGSRRIHGLFCGGTLSSEAQVVFLDQGVSVASNAPIPGAEAVGSGTSHVLIDLGSDEYTRGRPHPMIDPTVRDEELTKALANPTLAVILLDVVIGFGTHPDPAGTIVRVVAAAGTERPIVVASVTGTDDDPQDRRTQMAKLVDGGIVVAPTNADAATLALSCLVQDD
jgi:FdrA protein